MKKKVAFQKKIDFPTMIGEISAISLEHNLKFIDDSNVEGELVLSGKYKLTEASRLEEDFNYKIPVEIALTEKIDLNSAKIDITDFTYEVENEDVICNVELLIEGLEIVSLEEDNDIGDRELPTGKIEQKDEVFDIVEEIEVLEKDNDSSLERECDGDKKETKEIELPKIEKEKTREETNEIKEEIGKLEEDTIEKDLDIVKIEEKEDTNSSLFINLSEEKETYGTFLVYIVRQNESINSIIEKYNTSIEEIEKYNNLNDLSIGTKLIIPLLND